MSQDLVPYGEVSVSAVAGLFDAASPESLTDNERSLLTALIGTSDNLEDVMPDDLTAAEIWRNIELCSKVFVRIRRASVQLKLLIGRSLILIQNNPMVYENRNFSSFDQFMSDDITGLPAITGISRGELYKAMSVVKSMPTLSLSDAKDIAWTNLSALAKQSKEGDSDFPKWLEAAKTDSIEEFKERVYRSDNRVPVGDLEFDVLQLTTTKAQKARFDEFTTTPAVQAYCGTQSKAEILDRMIDEVANEWLMEQGADDLQEIPQ